MLLDHLVFNVAHNAFVNVRVAFEHQPWGFVRATVQARIMRLGFVRELDVILTGLDALVYLNVFVSILLASRKILLLGTDFFQASLNILDLLNYGFFVITFYYKALLILHTSDLLTQDPTEAARVFVDFDYIGGIVQTISSLNGFNCLLTWTKALSYISLFHRSSAMLIENITRSALNLGVLMAMFLIILWAYAQVRG